jgi:hypothetical protein
VVPAVPLAWLRVAAPSVAKYSPSGTKAPQGEAKKTQRKEESASAQQCGNVADPAAASRQVQATHQQVQDWSQDQGGYGGKHCQMCLNHKVVLLSICAKPMDQSGHCEGL